MQNLDSRRYIVLQLSFKAKCVALRICYTNIPVVHQYMIRGKALEVVDHHKYAGVLRTLV